MSRMQTEMHEIALPPYLAHDLDAWKKGVEEKPNRAESFRMCK